MYLTLRNFAFFAELSATIRCDAEFRREAQRLDLSPRNFTFFAELGATIRIAVAQSLNASWLEYCAFDEMHQSPLPKFSRLIILIYLFGAPTMLMIADGLHYYDHHLIAVVVFKIALVSFVVGSFGIAYMLPDRARLFGLIGTGLVALGAITISAMSTATLFQDMLKETGYTASQLKDLESDLEKTNALRVIYLPSGFAFPLGLVSLAIGIFRTRYTPNYTAFILIAGAGFHTIARFFDNISLLLISEMVLLVASSMVGWFMWRHNR